MQADLQEGVTLYTYARETGDFHAENIRIGNGEIYFDFISPLGNITNIQLGVPVSINIENGIAAMALAQISGLTEEEIRQGMATFRGVDRRFDFRVKDEHMVYVSDYAHHPAEIKHSILSIRELYEGKKITAVFQPHLYSRTQDFYTEFAESLSLVDDVILLDIYPARELPIPGVTSKLIYDNLAPHVTKRMCRRDEMVDMVMNSDFDVLLTLGAGDIENYAPTLEKMLKERR